MQNLQSSSPGTSDHEARRKASVQQRRPTRSAKEPRADRGPPSSSSSSRLAPARDSCGGRGPSGIPAWAPAAACRLSTGSRSSHGRSAQAGSPEENRCWATRAPPPQLSRAASADRSGLRPPRASRCHCRGSRPFKARAVPPSLRQSLSPVLWGPRPFGAELTSSPSPLAT